MYPGKMVLYRWRPGQVRAGQTEAAAMITKINPDRTCDLTIYPAMDRDPLFQQRVPPMSDDHEFHCWRLNDDDQRIATLERTIESLSDRLADLELSQTEPGIADPVAAAESMTGVHAAMLGSPPVSRRGRPRKVAEPT